MKDPAVGVAIVVLVAFGWLSLFDSFSAVAGLALIAVLVGPFCIFVALIRRSFRNRDGDQP